MKLTALSGLAIIAGFAVLPAGSQTAAPAPKPAAALSKPAAKPPSEVDSVIQLVKSGMSEGLIVKSLQKNARPVDLTPADMVKLKEAGVSENIISVMMDPVSAPAPAAAPAPATPPPAPVPAEAPAATSAPVIPASAAASAPRDQRKRVIVDDFDYSAVMTSVQAIFNSNQNIGKGIHAMLVKHLTESGKVVIVERGKIDEIKKEQDQGMGNRNKQGTGARVGRISGADAILAGDIVVFGRDDKKTKVNANGIGSRLCYFCGAAAGAIASGNDKDKAVVTVDYKLIDAETSEVIATGEATGTSTRKSSSIGAWAGAFGKGAGGASIDMTSSNFAETIIGEATQDCVNKLAAVMNDQAITMRKTVREVDALVADVSGNILTITAGGNDAVNVGDVFEILKSVREIKDPSTGEVLDRVTEKLGEMTVTSVRDKIATGSYTGAAATVNNIARKKIPGGGQQ